ncbi:hypothetical protein [Catenulispora pinisilvae]|nr:hypothetical protein [Catenulispora pinisilvae]
MNMPDCGTSDAVQQIRDLIRQAAAAAEAIGPVFLARPDNPDAGLDSGA